MADVVSTRDGAGCGKSFTRVTQEYEEDLDKKGGAETQVDLADDDPEGAEVGDSCSRCGVPWQTGHPAFAQVHRRWVAICRSPRSGCMNEWPTSTFSRQFARLTAVSAPLITFTI